MTESLGATILAPEAIKIIQPLPVSLINLVCLESIGTCRETFQPVMRPGFSTQFKPDFQGFFIKEVLAPDIFHVSFTVPLKSDSTLLSPWSFLAHVDQFHRSRRVLQPVPQSETCLGNRTCRQGNSPPPEKFYLSPPSLASGAFLPQLSMIGRTSDRTPHLVHNRIPRELLRRERFLDCLRSL